MDFLTSADDAALSAENVWNLFLGGSSQYRPFGNSVVLDGVDLHVWNNDPKPEFYTTFVSRLRELMNGNSSKQYTLSGMVYLPLERHSYPTITTFHDI